MYNKVNYSFQKKMLKLCRLSLVRRKRINQASALTANSLQTELRLPATRTKPGLRRFLKNGCNNTKYCDFEQQYHNIFVTISKIGRKSRKIFRLASLGVVFCLFFVVFSSNFCNNIKNMVKMASTIRSA